MTAITGNTYPVRNEMRAIGGQWDAANKAWLVPDDKAEYAKSLIPTGRHGERAASRSGSRRVSNYARFNSGAVVYTNKRGRCEDAPCCGCCS